MFRHRSGLLNCLGRLQHEAAISDRELAGRARISRAQLNRIRNGRVVPRVHTAMALANALGRRVSEVFRL